MKIIGIDPGLSGAIAVVSLPRQLAVQPVLGRASPDTADEVQEAKNWPNIPSQEKFQRAISKGTRNIYDTL